MVLFLTFFKLTFYLKYRPQTVNELDLENVRFQLKKVLSSKSIPHAFLFSGPRGLGKTSAARILAKAINCQKQEANSKAKTGSQKKPKKLLVESCNKCEACLSIIDGRAMDVIEIDGASNRGIDDIRQLKEKINLAPAFLANKVYIIDEVHMLTKEAFNALLKTLEEPPAHVFFILATTEPEKLPETIISRCFRLNFSKPTLKEVRRSLSRVIKGENLEINKKVVDLIVQKSDGSFRDGVKVLEQLAFGDKKITLTDFEKIYQEADEVGFLTTILKKNPGKALTWLNSASLIGINWQVFLQKTLAFLRDQLLASYQVIEDVELLPFSQSQLRLLIKLFGKAAFEQKIYPLPNLSLELAVVEYFEKITNKDSDVAGKHKEENDRIDYNDKGKKTTKPAGKKNIDGKTKVLKKSSPAFDVNKLADNWHKLLQLVKPENHSVEALLRSSNLEKIEGNEVVIRVFYEFHKGRLETQKARQIVEAALSQILGNNSVKVTYVLGKKEKLEAKETEADDKLIQAAEEIFGS